jgi:hypothetical protein
VKQIDETVARKVLEIVDAGLCKGAGEPAPGKMCIEAAVTFALGEPFSDEPSCVSHALRRLKIRLNDSCWSSNDVRAKGLRRLGIAQLGSKDALNDNEFVKHVARMTIQTVVPQVLRRAAKRNPKHEQVLLDAALLCETEPTQENAIKAKDTAYAAADAAAYAADAAAYAAADAAAYAADAAADADAYAAAYAAAAAAAASAAAYAAADKVLAEFAENVVQILVEMKAPGCRWLYLTA